MLAASAALPPPMMVMMMLMTVVTVAGVCAGVECACEDCVLYVGLYLFLSMPPEWCVSTRAVLCCAVLGRATLCLRCALLCVICCVRSLGLTVLFCASGSLPWSQTTDYWCALQCPTLASPVTVVCEWRLLSFLSLSPHVYVRMCVCVCVVAVCRRALFSQVQHYSPSLSAARYPADLCAFVDACLHLRPDKRWTAQQLAVRLRDSLSRSQPRSRLRAHECVVWSVGHCRLLWCCGGVSCSWLLDGMCWQSATIILVRIATDS